MSAEEAAPCRHAGAPRPEVVEMTESAIRSIADDPAFLAKSGLTKDEFELALPTAIQKIRGRTAASNSDRRDFMKLLLEQLRAKGLVSAVRQPDYGDDTVYRLEIPSVGSVAIIQKGCPDGNHSSVKWSVPEWADETYLWWLCDSLSHQPGEHVDKGVKRLRNRFFSGDYDDAVDGVIFHNQTCGSAVRPCPKMFSAISIDGMDIPPPCIWIMPNRAGYEDDSVKEFNWDGQRSTRFPAILLSLFKVSPQECQSFVGYVGFQSGPRGTRSTIASRYGPGKVSSFRSDAR